MILKDLNQDDSYHLLSDAFFIQFKMDFALEPIGLNELKIFLPLKKFGFRVNIFTLQIFSIYYIGKTTKFIQKLK